jgi:hypothetical protein
VKMVIRLLFVRPETTKQQLGQKHDPKGLPVRDRTQTGTGRRCTQTGFKDLSALN